MQIDNPKNEKIFSIHLNSNKAENFNRFTTSFFEQSAQWYMSLLGWVH